MRKVILGLFLGLIVAPAASAQTGKRVAVGGGFTVHKHVDSDFASHKNPTISLDYRFSLSRTERQGWYWAPRGGFSWSSSDTDNDIGGVETHIGRLRARPLMGGIERSYRQGPMKLGLSVVGGPSFNHFSASDTARAAYASRLGLQLTSIEVKNSFAVRPEVGVWYDLSSRFAAHAALNYVLNRPTAEIAAGGTTTSTRWNTDSVNIHFGLVVGIF